MRPAISSLIHLLVFADQLDSRMHLILLAPDTRVLTWPKKGTQLAIRAIIACCRWIIIIGCWYMMTPRS